MIGETNIRPVDCRIHNKENAVSRPMAEFEVQP